MLQAHHLLPAAISVIPPAEANRVLVKGHNAVVADGHPMGITAEVSQQLLWAREGRLGVHCPIFSHQRIEQFAEGLLAAQMAAQTAQAEPASFIVPAQSADKLAPEQGRQGFYRYEEPFTGRYPFAAS